MNDDLALIVQLHKCVGDTHTPLPDILKRQLYVFIQTHTPEHLVLVPSKNKTHKKRAYTNRTRKKMAVRKTQKRKAHNNGGGKARKNLTRKLKY